MIKLLPILFLLLSTSLIFFSNKQDGSYRASLLQCQPSVESINNISNEKTCYKLFTTEPFTGVATETYFNGDKKRELNYKDGKLNGVYIEWDENGNKVVEKVIKEE